jgi:hypothetical protein
VAAAKKVALPAALVVNVFPEPSTTLLPGDAYQYIADDVGAVTASVHWAVVPHTVALTGAIVALITVTATVPLTTHPEVSETSTLYMVVTVGETRTENVVAPVLQVYVMTAPLTLISALSPLQITDREIAVL